MISGFVSRLTAADVLLLVIIFVGLFAFWLEFPKWQVKKHFDLKIRDPKERADVEDNFRKTLGQLLGGLAVLFSAWFGIFQFLQQQKSAHDLLISNQVSKGFEQLANRDLFYAAWRHLSLEGVMNTSDEYREPVLEALCAFVRENTKDVPEHEAPKPTTQVQAALTVIGRRKKGTGQVYLREVRIPDSNLRGADLIDADLGGAILNGAILIGADLTDANLTGAHLDGTDLTSANLTRAKGLTQGQLKEACGANAKLPSSLTLDICTEKESFYDP